MLQDLQSAVTYAGVKQSGNKGSFCHPWDYKNNSELSHGSYVLTLNKYMINELASEGVYNL